VRNGADAWLPRNPKSGKQRHTLLAVYVEMMLQVARDYAGFDVRTLTMSEIRFFYNGLRPELKRYTSPKKK